MKKLILLLAIFALIYVTGCESKSQKEDNLKITECNGNTSGLELDLPDQYVSITLKHDNNMVYEKKYFENYFCRSLSQALYYEEKLKTSCNNDTECHVERDGDIITYYFTKRIKDIDPEYRYEWEYKETIKDLENSNYECQEKSAN